MRTRYIQDPQTHKLVPAVEYFSRFEKFGEAPMIMPDWVGDYTSPVDDRPIHGKRQWREDLKRNNSVPYEAGMKEHQVRMQAREQKEFEKRVERTVVELANR